MPFIVLIQYSSERHDSPLGFRMTGQLNCQVEVFSNTLFKTAFTESEVLIIDQRNDVHSIPIVYK